MQPFATAGYGMTGQAGRAVSSVRDRDRWLSGATLCVAQKLIHSESLFDDLSGRCPAVNRVRWNTSPSYRVDARLGQRHAQQNGCSGRRSAGGRPRSQLSSLIRLILPHGASGQEKCRLHIIFFGGFPTPTKRILSSSDSSFAKYCPRPSVRTSRPGRSGGPQWSPRSPRGHRASQFSETRCADISSDTATQLHRRPDSPSGTRRLA